MRNPGLPLFVSVLVLAAAVILACGSPAPPTVAACTSAPTLTNNTEPESVSVCPAVTAANGRRIQFVAVGDYVTAPSPALPESVIWGACQQNGFTTGVTVTNTGVAQCASGASGVYTVWATDGPVNCLVVSPCGACGPTGTAQLTCP